MSGPELRHIHAHRAIREGGLSGAIGKTEDMLYLLRKGKLELARQAADDLIG